MSPPRLRTVFWALILLAVALRVVAFAFQPDLHPDEIFQYVDPSTYKLRGVGWQTWEWRDGVRSWVIPAYNGAWLAIADWLGVRHLKFQFIQVHWAVVNALWVPVGWFGSQALSLTLFKEPPAQTPTDPRLRHWRSAVLGGLAMATYPTLVAYGPRILSETPSALLLATGLLLANRIALGDSRGYRLPWLMGLALSTGVLLRIAQAPLALIPIIWLASKRRWRELAHVCLATVVPALLFGIVDWITWGAPFSSYIGYLRFNLIEGKAAQFGTEPWDWYFKQIWDTGGIGFLAAFSFALIGWRATWPWLATALGLCFCLSTQAHKEERFLLLLWPSVIVPTAAVGGLWWKGMVQLKARWVLVPVAALFILMSAPAITALPRFGWNSHARDVRAAQVYVSRRGKVSGLLVEGVFDSSGFTSSATAVPMLPFGPHLLGNPIFNYAILTSEGSEREAVARGFRVLRRARNAVTMHRDTLNGLHKN